MKEGPAELFRCCLQTSALSKSTEGLAQEPRSRRGLVLKHDKAIIDLPDRENSTKKNTRDRGERGVERAMERPRTGYQRSGPESK